MLCRSITELFEDARQHKPSVIFLDKIDSLFPHNHVRKDSGERQLNPETNKQLLEQLTGERPAVPKSVDRGINKEL